MIEAVAIGAVAGGTSILLPTLGEVVSERSGVINLGTEGSMLAGALAAYIVGIQTGNPWIGIVAGMAGSEAFLSLLNDLASLSLVVPYMFVALAYIRARRKGMNAPFKMVRSTPVAIAVGVLVLVVSGAGYRGAGLYALQADSIDWLYVGIVYGGPVLLIGLGLLLRARASGDRSE